MHFVWIAIFLASTTSAGTDHLPRGIDPARAHLYAPQASESGGGPRFSCISADPPHDIPFSAVNDDYCDCEDGSDEPSTSACQNAFFHCVNEGHVSANIASSRVNDGVCDPECCDGSDEYLGIVRCVDRCKEAAEEARARKGKEIVSAQLGLRRKAEYLVAKRKQDQERNRLIDDTKREIADLEPRVEELKLTKDAAESTEAELRSKRTEGEAITAVLASQLDRMKSLLTNITSKIIALQAVRHECTATAAQIAISDIATAGDEATAGIAAIDVERNSSVSDEQFKAAEDAATAARNEYNSASTDLSHKKSALASFEARANLDLSPSGALGILEQSCLELATPEYTYSLCFFTSATQRHNTHGNSVNLGTWDGWKGLDLTKHSGKDLKYTVARFAKGEKCWNGPQRSVEVLLECGAENRLIAISEPNKCEYQARVQTPGICEGDISPEDGDGGVEGDGGVVDADEDAHVGFDMEVGDGGLKAGDAVTGVHGHDEL